MNVSVIKKFILTYIPRSFFNKQPISNIINFIRKIIFIFNIYKSLYVLKKNLLTFKTNNLHHHNYLRFYNIFFYREALLFKNFTQKLTSQLGQDLFVMSELNFKKKGYFVEFGATNGIDLSNTYFLEKYLNWQGIIAEPAHSYHHKLKQNRNCNIDTKCVWSKTGQILDFAEASSPDLSTLTTCIESDFHKDARKDNILYKVETISLLDLLKAHDAPKHIDYLSVDTEGSEYEILSAFDFTAYDIKIITVEHNYNAYREKIYNLLVAQGYQQVYKEHSQFDDWYVKL